MPACSDGDTRRRIWLGFPRPGAAAPAWRRGIRASRGAVSNDASSAGDFRLTRSPKIVAQIPEKVVADVHRRVVIVPAVSLPLFHDEPAEQPEKRENHNRDGGKVEKPHAVILSRFPFVAKNFF